MNRFYFRFTSFFFLLSLLYRVQGKKKLNVDHLDSKLENINFFQRVYFASAKTLPIECVWYEMNSIIMLIMDHVFFCLIHMSILIFKLKLVVFYEVIIKKKLNQLSTINFHFFCCCLFDEKQFVFFSYRCMWWRKKCHYSDCLIDHCK